LGDVEASEGVGGQLGAKGEDVDHDEDVDEGGEEGDEREDQESVDRLGATCADGLVGDPAAPAHGEKIHVE
jgi:hypothetical protein